ncbi:uncharacterized protein JN550_004482 [Neoarthrinium moseri]|uniref:uncharacterized protein n=1 Tax=Neoarthrinium moseri TaxID=1658444 RepID=UPI001FDDF1C6|nr:uncharacterized protein JN550_004482 [Neoarthrinium moseri]KAI1871488.1 hypothetical protein JN550_004482 [Neoarthrinium moseri]
MGRLTTKPHRLAKRTAKSELRKSSHDLAKVGRHSIRIALARGLEATASAHEAKGVTSTADGVKGSSWRSKQAPRSAGSQTSSRRVCGEVDYSNGVPTSRHGWYRIRGIVAEMGPRYLVEWEGLDPKTGHPWPSTWVGIDDPTESIFDVSIGAINEWERKKKEGRVEHDVLSTRENGSI